MRCRRARWGPYGERAGPSAVQASDPCSGSPSAGPIEMFSADFTRGLISAAAVLALAERNDQIRRPSVVIPFRKPTGATAALALADRDHQNPHVHVVISVRKPRWRADVRRAAGGGFTPRACGTE